MDWGIDNAPQIRLFWAKHIAADLVILLKQYFDDLGLFKGCFPEDYYHFSDQVIDRDDIDLGADVLAYVKQLTEATSHKLRAINIR